MSANTLPSAAQLDKRYQCFANLNSERLRRTRSVLAPRQQLLLDLLPLFFHINHPLLPGYAGQNVLAGIQGYTPPEENLQRVRDYFVQSFDFSRLQAQTPHIQSVFIMGSCGSVAQSPSSDLDVWLCHQPGLEAEQQAALEQKAQALMRYAETIELDLHIFLVDACQMKAEVSEQLSAEAVGSSQHYLLLDEFYRSGILLAGAIPLWWLVPAEQESDYQNYVAGLERAGLLTSWSYIDFGAVPDIPTGEFIGASIWQLYKAISSPYKAVLKLLLVEAYSDAHIRQCLVPLSLQHKRRLHSGEIDADKLDSYLLVYRYIEEYLQTRQQTERLSLLRRALYFKSGLQLSEGSDTEHWRQRVMSSLLHEWSWKDEQLRNLDTRRSWKLRRVREEHRFIVAELTRSYRLLQKFAEQYGGEAKIAREEMAVLGRKLFAAFERKANKVEWLNPGIVPAMTEAQLFFYQQETEMQSWAVSTSPPSLESDALIGHHEGIAGLLAWCLCNGLIDERSRLKLFGRFESLNETILLQISDHLKKHLPTSLLASDASQHQAFMQPKVPTKLLIYLNLERRGLEGLNPSAGLGSRYPIASVELVEINSWGEVSSGALREDEILLTLLQRWLHVVNSVGAQSQQSAPEIIIQSFQRSDQGLIESLESLFAALQKALIENESGRFVLDTGSEFTILQVLAGDLHAIRASNYSELIQCLGRGQASYSKISFGENCLQGSVLAAILEKTQADTCSLFYHFHDGKTDIFTSDERGSISYCVYPGDDPEETTGQYLMFLKNACPARFEKTELQVFALEKQEGKWACLEMGASVVEAAAAEVASGISAVIHIPSEPLKIDLYHGEQAWLENELGQQVLSSAVQALPAKVTAMPISTLRFMPINQANGQVIVNPQTSVYLRYKLFLERQLKEG